MPPAIVCGSRKIAVDDALGIFEQTDKMVPDCGLPGGLWLCGTMD
jgi:hypothetical protein